MTSVDGDSCRMRRNSVSPSTFGNRTSVMTTSKTRDVTCDRPSAPSPAVVTRWSASRSDCSRTIRRSGSSSMSRMSRLTCSFLGRGLTRAVRRQIPGHLRRARDGLIRCPVAAKERPMGVERWLAALAASPEAARALADQVPAALAIFDGEGRPLLHNPILLEILGVVPARVQDVQFLSSDGGELGRHLSPVTRALAGKVVAGEALQVRAADGTSCAVRVTAVPFTDADGP